MDPRKVLILEETQIAKACFQQLGILHVTDLQLYGVHLHPKRNQPAQPNRPVSEHFLRHQPIPFQKVEIKYK